MPASALSTPGGAGDRGGVSTASAALTEKGGEAWALVVADGKGEDPEGPRSATLTHLVSGVDGGAPVDEEPGGGGVAVPGGLVERGVGQ